MRFKKKKKKESWVNLSQTVPKGSKKWPHYWRVSYILKYICHPWPLDGQWPLLPTGWPSAQRVGSWSSAEHTVPGVEGVLHHRRLGTGGGSVIQRVVTCGSRHTALLSSTEQAIAKIIKKNPNWSLCSGRVDQGAASHSHPASSHTPTTRAEGSRTSPQVWSGPVSAGTDAVPSPARDTYADSDFCMHVFRCIKRKQTLTWNVWLLVMV